MRHRRFNSHVSDAVHVVLVMSLIITAFAPIFSKYMNTAVAQDAALTTGTFGYTSDGGSAYDLEDRYAGSQYTFTGATGDRATNITLWLEGWGAGENVMCTIFEWNDDKANLARTVIRNGGGGDGWYTFELLSPFPLTNGKTYALMARSSGTVNVGRTGSGFTQNIVRVANIFENPELAAWSSWDANTSGYNVSIYCNYVAFDNTGVSPASWYDNPWRSCKKILVRHESIEATLTNYPLQIKVISDDLKVGPQSDGDDFMFVLNSSGTKMNHEIEYFDQTSGTLYAWVNITSLSSTADTILWMYYNNSGASNQEAVADTWDDDYVAVFHLGETFSTGTGTYYDSTGSGNTGKGIEADGGGNPAVMLTDRGYCTNFSGVDDAISVENKLNYNAPFGVEAWVKSDDSVNGWDNKNDNPVARYYGADGIRETTAGSGRCAAQYTYDGTSMLDGSTTGYAAYPHWYYAHSEITTTNINAVLKGLLTKSTETSTGPTGHANNLNYSASYYFAIGSSTDWQATGLSGQFNGSVDEVRFSIAARSSAYKNTTFRSMWNPGNFIFVFDEVSGGAPSNNPPALSSPSPSAAASNQDPEPTLAITVNDQQGDTMNITWFESPDNSVWTEVQENLSLSNGTYRHEYTNASSTSNTYYWAVNASDGTDYTNTSYSFSLKGDFYQKWKIDNNLYTGGMAGWAVAGDVTGDGIMEIFFVAVCNDTNAPGQNVIVCLNGSTGATEWYQTINTSATDLAHTVGTLADLDMDGTMEYVHGGGYNTFAWNAENGTEFWNSTLNSAWSGHDIVYDERVNHCWIYQPSISSYSDNKIWRINGTTGVADISSTDDHGQSCNGGIAHWDIDRDGDFEIVATGSTGGGAANGIKVYDLDLNLEYALPWWQQTSHTPILEDIDGDGEMEIISAENDGGSTCDGELHIYNADGTLYDNSVPNWGAHDEGVVWENTTGNWLMNSRRGSNYGEQYCLIWNLTSDALELNWTDDNEYGIPYKCDIYPHNGDDYEILYPSAWSDDAGTVYYMTNYSEIVEVTNMWSGSPIITDLDGDGYNEGVFIQSNGAATCFDFGTAVRGQGVNTWTEQAGPRRTNSWDHYETPVVYQARFTAQSPADNATGVSTSTSEFAVTINDPRGTTFNWTIETLPDVGDSSGNTASNGSKTCSLTGLAAGTTYTVYVNVSDTFSDGYTRWQVYNFTTLGVVTSSVDAIIPYWQDSVSEVTINATAAGAPGNVTLWYRYSTSNASAYNATVAALSPDFRWLLNGDFNDCEGDRTGTGSAVPNWVSTIIPDSDIAQCGDFVPDDEMLVADSPLINSGTGYLGQERSMSFWIEPDTIPANTGNTIWSQGGGTNSISLYTYDWSGTYYVYASVVEGANEDSVRAEIELGQKYHVGVTYDFQNQNISIYLNGTLIESDTSLAVGIALSAHSGDIALAGQSTSCENHNGTAITVNWDGSIADFAYWSDGAILSQADFQSIYEAGAAGFGGWTNFTTDSASPWTWAFTCPNGTGYYEFYSMANKTGLANESAPGSADAICHVNYTADSTTWQIVSNTIGDGTLGYDTTWQTVSNTIGDGTLGYDTSWQVVSNTLGDGTLGATPTTWQIVSNAIGDGTLAADPISWQIVSSTIGGGTLGYTTTWQVVSNTVGDGTLGYATTWQIVSDTIGDGSIAATPTTWQIVSDTIGDGTLGGTTTWQIVSNTIGDGTLAGATTWQIVSNTVGDGTLGATPTTWQIVTDTIGDGTLAASPTTWQIVSNTIGDGTLANVTTWQIVSNTIGDGTLAGVATTWQIISNTTGEGTLAHVSTWQQISTVVGDGILAADPTAWQIVSNTIGDGTLANPAELFIRNPNPANNSIGNALALTWNVTIESIVGPFNWSINCSNGLSNNASTDTNGSKTLTLPLLAAAQSYTVWVNTSAAGYYRNKTFNFTTWIETVIGTFTYTVQGTEIIVTPNFGHGVEQYKWQIRNDVIGGTEWIDVEDAASHTFTVTWGSEYRVTLVVYGDNLTRESSQIIKIRRDPEYTYDPSTGERVEPLAAAPEGDDSPYNNIFGVDGPSDAHLFAFIIALAICIVFLARDRKRLYMLVATRRKKDERRNEKGKGKRKGPEQ